MGICYDFFVNVLLVSNILSLTEKNVSQEVLGPKIVLKTLKVVSIFDKGTEAKWICLR